MSAAQSSLPGLFSATAQGAHVATVEPDRATNVLANCLLSVAQKVACDPTNDTTDKKLQADLRYRAAVAQAITVSLGLTEQSRRHASDRCAFLAKHLRDRGPAGIAGKLAKVALLLGYAAQRSDQVTDLTEAFILLDEAVAMHAIVHRLDVTNARTAQQLSFLHMIQPSVH